MFFCRITNSSSSPIALLRVPSSSARALLPRATLPCLVDSRMRITVVATVRWVVRTWNARLDRAMCAVAKSEGRVMVAVSRRVEAFVGRSGIGGGAVGG